MHGLPAVRVCTVFENAAVVSNSEVYTMLSEYLKQRKETSASFVPPPLVAKTVEYVEKFNCGKNPAAVQNLRQ